MNGSTFMHLLRVIFKNETPYTQTTEAEVQALVKYSGSALKAVEIGVFEGFTTSLLASGMPDSGILYGIDNFEKGRLGICYSKLVALFWLRKKSISKKVKLIEKLSSEAVDDVPDNIDFIFIDGDHSWNGIHNDWVNWSPKIKQGGIIALHDTSVPSFDTSRGALDSVRYYEEIISRNKNYILKDTVDSLNILQKINQTT